MQLWLNGKQLESKAVNAGQAELRASGPALARRSGNQVVAIAAVRTGQEDPIYFKAPPKVYQGSLTPLAKANPRVHYLGVGVTDMTHAAAFAKPLAAFNPSESALIKT